MCVRACVLVYTSVFFVFFLFFFLVTKILLSHPGAIRNIHAEFHCNLSMRLGKVLGHTQAHTHTHADKR